MSDIHKNDALSGTTDDPAASPAASRPGDTAGPGSDSSPADADSPQGATAAQGSARGTDAAHGSDAAQAGTAAAQKATAARDAGAPRDADAPPATSGTPGEPQTASQSAGQSAPPATTARSEPFAAADRQQTSPYDKAMLTAKPSALEAQRNSPGAQPDGHPALPGADSPGKKADSPGKNKGRQPRPSFRLTAKQAAAYEDELRGRIGLLPTGLTLPRTIQIRGWVVTALAAIIAFVTRFWNLTHPRAIVFDETYYVKGAFSLLRMGYEGNWKGDDANDLFLRGDYSALQLEADNVVHPPFGKWVMAVGQALFGTDNGVGWRFSTAFLGVLSVILLVRIAMRLFRSPWLAGFAGLAMALDGMGIVLSRTGILDNVLAFFVLLGVWFVLLDREKHGARLAHRIAHGPLRDTPEARAALAAGDYSSSHLLTADPWGPRIFARPYLLAAGISLGLACGVKWSGIYAIAAFGLLVLLFGIAMRKAMGAPLYVGGAAFRDGLPAFLALVPTALVTYIAQWYPWFRNPNSWDRNWAVEAAARGEAMPISWAPDAVNSFLHYHQSMWSFHHSLSSEHTYQSQAWHWLVQGRPVSFYWKDEGLSCGSSKCVEAISSIGNVAVWWLALIGLAVVVYGALARSDWRAWTILAGYAGLWAPWLLYTNRTIFQFYAVVLLPFVVLALTYALGTATRLLGPSRSPAPAAGASRRFLRRRATEAPAAAGPASNVAAQDVTAEPAPYAAAEPNLAVATSAAGGPDEPSGADHGMPGHGTPGTKSAQTSSATATGTQGEAAGAGTGEASQQQDLPQYSPFSGVRESLPSSSPSLPNGSDFQPGGSERQPGDSHQTPVSGAFSPSPESTWQDIFTEGHAAPSAGQREPEERGPEANGKHQWWLPPKARRRSYAVLITVGALIAVTAAFWFPIWTGMTVPRSFWQLHMWFQSWI